MEVVSVFVSVCFALHLASEEWCRMPAVLSLMIITNANFGSHIYAAWGKICLDLLKMFDCLTRK